MRILIFLLLTSCATVEVNALTRLMKGSYNAGCIRASTDIKSEAKGYLRQDEKKRIERYCDAQTDFFDLDEIEGYDDRMDVYIRKNQVERDRR